MALVRLIPYQVTDDDQSSSEHSSSRILPQDSDSGGRRHYPWVSEWLSRSTTIHPSNKPSSLSNGDMASNNPQRLQTDKPTGCPSTLYSTHRRRNGKAPADQDDIDAADLEYDDLSYKFDSPKVEEENNNNDEEDQDSSKDEDSYFSAASHASACDTMSTLIDRLNEATKNSNAAEILHAYDLGVLATLQSMTAYWAGRSDARHVSNVEKRIFRREAQRLDELLGDAEKQSAASYTLLAKKLDEKHDLLNQLTAAERDVFGGDRVDHLRRQEENEKADDASEKDYDGDSKGGSYVNPAETLGFDGSL
ncbi:hypothetical protein B0H63DRAFT_524576 [Podospora didyma]|uniref:Uncharacterized protein n=1 Tax=Podospora didyma TaxID=330526 RepID=A0AAE0NI28_9PEZI|nr:hypothetical protein B0H63DRAFT_524576 [Podospora didyma]